MPRAIETYESGLGRLADDPAGRSKLESNIGSVYFTLGDVDGAIARFRAAIAADPGSPRAHSNLGLALASRGRRFEAIEELRTALRLSPGDPEIRNQLHHLILRE